MPLFEFICKKCGHRFEALVFGSNQPACPLCKTSDLEQLISSFATSSTKSSGGVSGPGISCGSSGGGG